VKLIKWIKEHKVWATIIIIAILLLPILIVHSLFEINTPYKWLEANWKAGEILGYIGSILGAAATITAVVLTIIFTQENQKTERKLSMKPYFQTDYHPIFYRDKAIEKIANRAVFVQYPYDENEGISSSYEPPYYLKETDAKNNMNMEERVSAEFIPERYYILQYSLSNVGAGNAINISFTINDKRFIPPFSLTVNNTKVFVIIFKAELLKNKTRSIHFKFVFQDVASMALYEQHETITLYMTENGSINSCQYTDDVISLPKEI
jgi:hypothetical protein